MSAQARFCGECGSKLDAAAAAAGPGVRPGGDAILKWFIAGTVVLALHATAIILAVRRPGGGDAVGGAASPPFAAGSGPVADPGRATTDLSTMTPREQADRLYDRIARATEAGDSAQVEFFGPMAIQAYQNVSPLDVDARLHVGLIHLALGNAAGAAAQADTIAREARTHLFGPLLQARAAEASGDAATARAAYRAYLQNYDAERAKRLNEYELHTTMLGQARDDAQRVAGR